MKHLFRLIVLSTILCASAFGQGAPPISVRPWLDNYAKIVALKGLVSPGSVGDSGAHLPLKTAIESNAGRTIVFDSAKTYWCKISVQQSINVPSNTTLDLNGATVWFFGDIPDAKGFNVTGNNVTIKNGKIYWTTLAGFSANNGEYGNPICIGEYDSVGTDISGTRILNINFKHDQTDNGTIAIFGQAHDILIDGCSADTLGSGALVLAHWGRPPNIASAPSATNYTTHPYNITIQNCTVNRMTVAASEMISLAGAYNVKVENCRLVDGKSFTQVYCGDYGYGYAKPTTASGGAALDKYTIYGQGISFENCWAWINDVPDAFNVVGKPDYTQTPALFDTVVFAMPVNFNNCFAINSIGTSGSAGWNIQNSRGVSIENCFATGMEAAGILIGENAWSTKVRGGLYEKNTYGIVASYGTDSLKPRSVIIDGVHFRNNSGADIQAGFSNGMIYGCTFGDTINTSTSAYAVLTTNKAFNINIIGNEVQSVGTAGFSINSNSSASCFNNFYRQGLADGGKPKYTGVTPNAFMGTSGETFQLPAGAVIQPSSSYLLFRAINNTLRFQYNAGTGAIAAFYGSDTTADVKFFNDSALFTFGSGAGGIKLYNSSTGSITLSGGATGSNITYTVPTAYGTSGQVLADNGSGALYWTSSGGGGGTFTQIGSMTVDPAFANSTADNDWIGLGSLAGRIRFEDGTTDTIAFMGAALRLYGPDTTDTDAALGEGDWRFYLDNSTNIVAQLQNGTSSTPLTLNRYGNEGYGLIINKGVPHQSASMQLNSSSYKGDAFIGYKDSASTDYFLGIKSFDSSSFVLTRTQNSGSATDSLSTATKDIAMRYNDRSFNWQFRSGGIFDIADTLGNSQFQLKRSGTSGWWTLRNLDQIGDSTGYFKFINGFITSGNTIYPATTYSVDTVTSFQFKKSFTFADAYGKGPAATLSRLYNTQMVTTDPAAAGNDSTMSWVAFRDSALAGAASHQKDTVIGYIDIEYTHKIDSIVCLSQSLAANDSLEISFFRGPRLTSKTNVKQDSTYNAAVFAAFHPATAASLGVASALTNSKVTGSTLVGNNLLPPGRYYVRVRMSFFAATSAIHLFRLDYYGRNR